MRENLNVVRQHIAGLRAALLLPTPEAIERSLPGLIEAAGLLREAGDRPSRELHNDLAAVQSDLRSVARLIDHGAALNLGWARLLGAATAGYTPSGEAAPLTAPGSISVQG